MLQLVYRDRRVHLTRGDRRQTHTHTCASDPPIILAVSLTFAHPPFCLFDVLQVCNLASIALPMFVKDKQFDHQKLYEVCQDTTTTHNNQRASERKRSTRTRMRLAQHGRVR